MRKGDMIVVGHALDYFGGDIVEILAMYQWSHAVMYMGNEKTIDAHPIRPRINGSNGSVGWGNIHEFLYNPSYNKIAFLTVDSKDNASSLRAGDEAESYQGEPFEYPSSWDDLTSSWSSDDAFYCAELLYKSWKTEGIDLRPALLPVPWIRPNDIYVDWKTKIIKRIGCLECPGGEMPHTRP